MKQSWLILAPLLLSLAASAYNLEGIFPNCGPTTGGTRVTIYSPSFKGMNHSDHPNPRCLFPNEDPEPATWIHCYGSKTNPSPTRDQTCLNCESGAHDAGTVDVKVSIAGDFSDSATIKFTYYVQPEALWAVPSIGWKVGGTFVQVYGNNFAKTDYMSCAFGTVNVPATYVSPTLVTCRSPDSDIVDSSIPLRVSQNDQQYSISKIRYYYHTVPEVSALTPKEGPTAGGTEVYIQGRQIYPFQDVDTEFHNTTFARFGTDNYVKLELINRTHAKAISPPSASGSPVPVEITFNNQEWTSNGILFHYYQAPYVVKLVPDIGKLSGGTNFTVVGANFHDSKDIKCKFGKYVVPGHFINETSVWCIVPKLDHVGSYDFSLAIDSDHFSGNKIKYLAILEPSVTSISPTCGPTTGNTQIAVVGKNFVFTGINRVSCIFGNAFRQPATVINETLIFCDSPRVVDRFGNNINDTSSLHFRLTLNDVEVVNTKYNFSYYTTPVVTSIEPKIGTLQGGTPVAASGGDFSNSCRITCRFATSEVPGKLSPNKDQVICISPAVPCQGDSLVQVSLNGQQYDDPTYVDDNVVFSNYLPPIVAYSLPKYFPTSGESSVGIYGSGFLLSKNSSTTSNGSTRVSYKCRFLDSTGAALGVSDSEFFNDYYIHCKTPAIHNATTGVNLEVSIDGLNWIPVPNSNMAFYEAPVITDIDPKFGKIKQEGATLAVFGRNFECPDDDCSNVNCLFTSPNFKIVTNGFRNSSELVTCEIPAISMPEDTIVQVTMNGVDYTSQKIHYTFYDAFVIGLNPPYVPIEGNTNVRVIGFGFANTSDLLVRLEDSRDGSVLTTADGESCVFPATYVSPTELRFVMPAQSQLRTASGDPVGYVPIQVETSIHGDAFTKNNVQLNYFENPLVGGGLQVKNASYVFHSNAVDSILIPIDVQVPPGIREQDFLRRTRPLCKYSVGGQEVITEGKLVQYPYPRNANVDITKVSIECATPQLGTSGNGTVSVSLNGVDFAGNLPVTAVPQLQITSVQPRCGPIEGGTQVSVGVNGVQDSDLDDNVALTWSNVNTGPLTRKSFTKANTVLSAAPPASSNSTGGQSLLTFSEDEKVWFADNQAQVYPRNHLESSSEFLYYQRPIITRVFPHGGAFNGGTPITVEGAGFFHDDRFNATPKCKFGSTVVEATVLSSTRLQCVSPPGTLGQFTPLSVTINGQDEADSQTLPSFAYINTPNIASISPVIGPATGGTMLEITGEGFVDMSRYPDEFSCIFKPFDLSEEPKTMPASYINSTTVACSTPGGWRSGTVTYVELSFNGVDYSNNKQAFRFYQIDRVFPLSGPSVGGTVVSIIGSGLIPDIKKGNPACRVGGLVTNATSVSSELIQFQLPPAWEGPDFNGHADLYYTLDGEKWEQVVPGFTFYQQPEIDEISPKFLSSNGGRITLKGKNFKENFYDANLTCRVDNTTVPGQYVSESEAVCPFGRIDLTSDAAHYLQVSLNGATFTPEDENTAVSIFKVSSVKPPMGVVEGGTQVIFFSLDNKINPL